MKPSVVIGLTGGFGCGKSSVMAVLEEMQLPVYDTDQTAHKLLAPNTVTLKNVIDHFGDTILDATGRLNRKKLAAIVFSNKEALQALNDLLHPYIFRDMNRWIAHQRPLHAVIVVVIPLLFETGSELLCDTTWVVAADEAIVYERLNKVGWLNDDIKARIAAQLPLSEKIKRADTVIWNNEDINALRIKTKEALQKIDFERANINERRN